MIEGSETRTHFLDKAVAIRLIKTCIVLPIWFLARVYTLWQIGIFTDFDRVSYFDINAYASWSGTILQNHQLPTEVSWQYPPGAAFIFLLPRLFVTPYQITFIALLIAFDGAAIFALVRLARRTNRWLGVWFWIFAIAVTGNIALLRFDIIPTALVIIGLSIFAMSRSSFAFGVVVGLATAIKAWPILLLVGVPTTSRLLRVGLTAGGVLAAVFWGTFVLFGNPFAFIFNHAGRGLEIESIAATPWYIWELLTGAPIASAVRNGSPEIVDPIADIVAHVMFGAMILLGVVVALWWWSTRDERRTAALSIDVIFASTLLYIGVSEVLSPQYLIWLIGIAAVGLCLPQARPTWWLAFFALAIVLNGLMVDHWSDLVTNGRPGALLLVGRNACLGAMAVLLLGRIWRATRRHPAEHSTPDARAITEGTAGAERMQAP